MTNTSDNASRRNFLKVGAGVVAGAVVGAVGVGAYESSVIGSNNSSSSSTVASLSNELTSTQSALADTTASLNAANSAISSLNSQLTATQGALSSAQSSLGAATAQNATLSSQNATLSSQNATLNGQLASTQTSLSGAQSSLTAANSQLSSATSQLTSLQTELDTFTGFLYLNTDEQTLLPAVLSTIIPTDSNGPGATTAGIVYFIDRQLASDYGTSGTNYTQPPYILPNVTGPVTVEGTIYPSTTPQQITYPNGTPQYTVYSGAGYQYSMNMRYFWRWSMDALESYANSAYGGNFEKLSAANQTQVLQDLWNNKPTSFNGIRSSDFAYELFMMAWAGFLSDPMYGGNRNMVGWTYTGFSGVNQGNFYGEGYTLKELMVMSKPVRLQPVSLAQYQKGSP